MKVRPCKKACGYPALKGRQFCQWHALMRMSSLEQGQASEKRLKKATHDESGMTKTYFARMPKELWPSGERWCAGCQSFVPLFYCTGSRCKACASMASHAARLEKVYGITDVEYARILKLQGGRCAICRNRSRTIRFATDHDHDTGEVRGLLCKRCNHDLLGGGHDDVLMLYRAIEYLLFPPAQQQGPPPVREQVWAALEQRLYLHQRLTAPQPVEAVPAPF